jgi:hypothetical protein
MKIAPERGHFPAHFIMKTCGKLSDINSGFIVELIENYYVIIVIRLNYGSL